MTLFSKAHADSVIRIASWLQVFWHSETHNRSVARRILHFFLEHMQNQLNRIDANGNDLFIRLKTIYKNDSYKSCCFDYRLWMHWNKGFRKWFPTYHQNLSVHNDFTASLFHCFWLTAPCYFIHRLDFDGQLIFFHAQLSSACIHRAPRGARPLI